MPRSFPPDVFILDTESLLHARIGRGRKDAQIRQAKSYRLMANTFANAVVTPELANAEGLAEALRRVKNESGRIDKASILLPDSWFRINLLDLQSLPEARDEADHMVRWSLKRTLPIEPEALRLVFDVISRAAGQVKVLTVGAVDATVTAIERTFEAAGIEVVLIEPLGLNMWNAITAREAQTTRDRLMFYIREKDFTTAAFRGGQPMFIRSRNLSGDRTIEQEIRLSASYLRDTLRADAIENCYVAGNRIGSTVVSTISDEFKAPVKTIELTDFTESAPSGVAYEAELAAATGVFT